MNRDFICPMCALDHIWLRRQQSQHISHPRVGAYVPRQEYVPSVTCLSIKLTRFCFSAFRFIRHFYSPAQLVESFYPQRPSEQGHAVVTDGVFPSPRYLPSVLSLIGFPHSLFSAFYARRFATNFANSRPRAFGLSICKKGSLVRCEPSTSTAIGTRFIRTFDLLLNSLAAYY